MCQPTEANLAFREYRSKAHDGKTTYPSKAVALATARRAQTAHGGALRPYRCFVCGHWHIGHYRKCRP